MQIKTAQKSSCVSCYFRLYPEFPCCLQINKRWKENKNKYNSTILSPEHFWWIMGKGSGKLHILKKKNLFPRQGDIMGRSWMWKNMVEKSLLEDRSWGWWCYSWLLEVESVKEEMKYFEKSREIIKLDKPDIGVGQGILTWAWRVKKHLRELETGKGVCQQAFKARWDH